MVKYVEARDGCQLNLPSVFTTQAQQLTFIIKSCTVLFCFNQRDKKKLVSNPTTFGKFVIQYKALQMTIASTYATGAILLERCGGFLQRLVA